MASGMKCGNLERRMDSLERQIVGLKTGQEEIKTILEELDPKNASNYADIAKLKRAEESIEPSI